ncbi:hypothetical protein KEM55_002797, partial [Ascosphaera atra]
SAAGQLAFLHNCVSYVHSAFRKRGPTLLSAKVLVIARILKRGLSQGPNAPPILENTRKQLASFRRVSLKRIDKLLAAPQTSIDNLVEALAAYCLTTNASLSDAIRHFHNVRLEAIASHAQKRPDGDSHDNIQKALSLYIETLERTSVLLSGKLSSAIAKLTANPILHDPELLNNDGLAIDIFKRWLTEDVKNFTPWIKNDELTQEEKDKLIKQWSRQALDAFSKGVSENLQRFDDVSKILDIRKSLLETWLPVQASVPAHSSLDVLERLREIVNSRLSELLHKEVDALIQLGSDISAVIDKWPEMEHERAVPSLWRTDMIFKDYSDGAAAFKRDLTNRALGKTNKLLKVMEPYHIWLKGVDRRVQLIKELKGMRWDSMIEEDEDPDTVPTIVGILTTDDYDLLVSEHDSTLENAFKSLSDALATTTASLDGPSKVQRAAFLLRCIREIRGTMPRPIASPMPPFAADVVPKLHDILADFVSSRASPEKLTRQLCSKKRRCVGRLLWEGEPELPMQPSAAAFKLLQQVVGAMDMQGQDLWNPAAVGALKGRFAEVFGTAVRDGVKGSDEYLKSLRKEKESVDEKREDKDDEEGEKGTPVQEGSDKDEQDKQGETDTRENKSATKQEPESESKDPVTEEQNTETPTAKPTQPEIPDDLTRDRKIQLLFDILYLEEALQQAKPNDEQSSHLKDAADFVIAGIEPELPSSARKELAKRAGDYWEQTQLLFGLLA